MNPEQARIHQLAENLLGTLDAVVPSSTMHYAVEDARRSLKELIRKADTIVTVEPTTWTFFGHWEGDRIVVEYSLPGEVHDERKDTGEWPEGLWAASASGLSVEQAQEEAVAEYEDDEDDEDDEDEEEYDHSRAKEDARNAMYAERPFTKKQVRLEVLRQAPADHSPAELDQFVDVVLAGTYPTLQGSVARAITGEDA